MNKETLRMQMLSGVITEGQYKAKLEKLNSTKEKNSLNEHYIAGGIVGVGAINNPFEGRKKEKYEDAFEYFLSSKYSLNEAEGDVMVDSATLVSYIDELISLADDMEYTPEMVQELESLKTKLSGGKMSVENALDIIQQTIDITEDEIDAVEALGQAVDYDDTIISKAREISGLDEGKEVEEPSLYEGEEPLKNISDEEKAEYLVYMTGMDYSEAIAKVRQGAKV